MHLDVSYQNRYNDNGLGTVLIFLDCRKITCAVARGIFSGSFLDCFHKNVKMKKECEEQVLW